MFFSSWSTVFTRETCGKAYFDGAVVDPVARDRRETVLLSAYQPDIATATIGGVRGWIYRASMRSFPDGPIRSRRSDGYCSTQSSSGERIRGTALVSPMRLVEG